MKALAGTAAGALIVAMMLVAALVATRQQGLPAMPGPSPSAWIAVDGDTIKSPAGVTYRIEGLDTPETFRARCSSEKAMGERARRRLQELLASPNARVIESTKKSRKTGEITAKLDKYGRTLAKVRIGKEDVSDILIREGLARRYAGGKRERWC